MILWNKKTHIKLDATSGRSIAILVSHWSTTLPVHWTHRPWFWMQHEFFTWIEKVKKVKKMQKGTEGGVGQHPVYAAGKPTSKMWAEQFTGMVIGDACPPLNPENAYDHHDMLNHLIALFVINVSDLFYSHGYPHLSAVNAIYFVLMWTGPFCLLSIQLHCMTLGSGG